jgi:hypothetical protein
MPVCFIAIMYMDTVRSLVFLEQKEGPKANTETRPPDL